jgi:purine nucleosidase
LFAATGDLQEFRPMRDARRDFLAQVVLAGALATFHARGASAATLPAIFRHPLGPRCRVLYINDLAGDVDGLFSAAHIALSTAVELSGLVASGTSVPSESALHAAVVARELLKVAGRADVPVFEGSPGRLKSISSPDRSPGVTAIIREANRTDSQLPLYVAVGGGLTEVASALLVDPSIASRFTLIWVGGAAYPAGGRGEYNFSIDPLAVQHVFNDTDVGIWQVPSSAYATCQVSMTELATRVRTAGAMGAWLYRKLVDELTTFATKYKFNTGETYTLGDSPLVLLTALMPWPPSFFGQVKRYETAGSSRFVEMLAPRIKPDGTYDARTDGRKIRVFEEVDNRMMLEDMFAKLQLSAS